MKKRMIMASSKQVMGQFVIPHHLRAMVMGRYCRHDVRLYRRVCYVEVSVRGGSLLIKTLGPRAPVPGVRRSRLQWHCFPGCAQNCRTRAAIVFESTAGS
jgi:hypothetical protein